MSVEKQLLYLLAEGCVTYTQQNRYVYTLQRAGIALFVVQKYSFEFVPTQLSLFSKLLQTRILQYFQRAAEFDDTEFSLS